VNSGIRKNGRQASIGFKADIIGENHDISPHEPEKAVKETAIIHRAPCLPWFESGFSG
jgi:hypothetical protein